MKRNKIFWVIFTVLIIALGIKNVNAECFKITKDGTSQYNMINANQAEIFEKQGATVKKVDDLYCNNNDDEYIAICEYSGVDKKSTLLIAVNKEYKFEIKVSEYIDGVQTISTNKSGVIYDLEFDDFVNDDNKFSCDKAKTLYADYYSNFDGTLIDGCAISKVSKDSNDSKYGDNFKGYDFHHETLYNLSDSTVYLEDFDLGEVNGGEWIDICHYGDYYFKFNKSTYETNIPFHYNGPASASDRYFIMQTIVRNNYSCPYTICENGLISGGYVFSEDYDSKRCIASTTYTGDYKCGPLKTLMKDYNQSVQSENLQEKNNLVNEIKNLCNSMVSTLNYDDSNNCIKECLSVSNIINNDKSNFNECGFSDTLMAWVINIMNWIKYIVPVIIIIVTIIDFIKAIGADKDDEIKKSQSKFIKRLIAAALVFLIPLIIVFILEKMGFDAKSCGLF